ncbi:MAG: hypothetical protein HYX61_08045 [Gammaproteobacteria bacterium]|jgi:hypothetical protein|nr:hypothetical protein [Gammaproteobacteria bacterium]
MRYNILLLANDRHITTAVIDHIQAITDSKQHQWYIENPLICKTLHKVDLNIFDAIGFHYSIRPFDPYYVPRALYKKIKDYQGLKFQFLQDEYKQVHITTQTMIDLGIQLLFTLVKPSLVDKAYNCQELQHLKKISILTGYTPQHLELMNSPPIKERTVDIFYRSRIYDFWLGKLTQERNIIAQGVIERARQYSLNVDISLIEQERLYGSHWYTKHMQSKTVLCTESGASIWDFDGNIEKEVKQALRKAPHLSFDQIYEKLLKRYEGNLMYNACSPRLFEAIALRSALIMFPGEYSGVCEPDKHYIALEKDFSNFHEVVNKIKDLDFLQELVDFAHKDIIASGRFSQSRLSKLVNNEIQTLLSQRSSNGPYIDHSLQDITKSIKDKTSQYRLLNAYHILLSELIFSVKNIFYIVFDPRHSFKQKYKLLLKGIKRYFAYVKPRFKEG